MAKTNTKIASNLTKDIIVNNQDDSLGTGVENIPSLKEHEENTSNKLININTCSKEDLLTLNGVGSSKADKIIEYRNQFGYFKTIEDIKNVSGIGDSAFEKIKDYITV